MKISEKWLRKLINFDFDTKTLCDRLTMAGLEVEAVTVVKKSFHGVVIGEILEAKQHPNADRLRVCQVSIGQETPLEIVCGAANARAGIKVAVAVIGATLKNGAMQIKPAQLRGVESHGMLCSAAELEINASNPGIIELAPTAPLGQLLDQYLDVDDTILDLNITPNRGDCLSMFGMAREVAALNNQSINYSDVIKAITVQTNQPYPIIVTAQAACPRYIARVIRNIDLQKITPAWLADRLLALGMRLINPVVDVMNYVMLELGQPLHAFDFDKIHGAIDVRMAHADEELQILTGAVIKLNRNDLCICDSKQPIALAGIMGGKNSEVDLTTKNIVLESAFFTPETIAQSAQRHDLHSDAAYRFERGVDYNLQRQALDCATDLLLAIVGGAVQAETELVAADLLPQVAAIKFDVKTCRQLLGIKLSTPKIKAILECLGMSITAEDKDVFMVTVPSYRFDITNAVDLIEEVGRLYGYRKIPQIAPNLALMAHSADFSLQIRRKISDFLVAQGYREVVNYSFGKEGTVTLANPISAEYAVMRTSLLPGLLDTLVYNQNHQVNRQRLFTLGSCFLQYENRISEPVRLAGIISGNLHPEQWGEKAVAGDFFDLKQDVVNLCKLADQCAKLEFRNEISNAMLHPTLASTLYYDGKEVGYLGRLHPNRQDALGIITPIYVFEIDLSFLAAKIDLKFKNISKFPYIERDIAVVVAKELKWLDIEHQIYQAAGGLLKSVRLFDVYEGEGVPPQHKSLAVHLVFQDVTRTLVEEEVENVLQKILNSLKQSFDAKLRG